MSKLSTRSRRRVAILGAAFDPIHYGHCAMAALVLQQNAADTVWLCPSPARWDKQPTASPEQRLKWVTEAATQLREQGLAVEACNLELSQPVFRGTHYFLNMLAQIAPDSEFLLVLGQDTLASILSWKDQVVGEENGAQLLTKYPLLVTSRDASGTAAAEIVHRLAAELEKRGLQFSRLPQILPPFASLEKELLPGFISNNELAALSSTRMRSALLQDVSPGTFVRGTHSREPPVPPEIFLDIYKDIVQSGAYTQQV